MWKSISVLLLLATWTAGATELVVNGGLEQNGGLATNVFDGWTHSDTTSGSWYAQQGLAATSLPGRRHSARDEATLSFDVAFSTTNSFNPAPSIDETCSTSSFAPT